VLPAESWRTRLAGLLAGAGRQGTAVALVVLLALGGAGLLWLRGDARPAGAAVAGAGGAPADGGGPGGTLPTVAPGGTATAGTAGGMVAVHVAGHVRHPGVVELPPGSRVMDAITAAGGVTAGADLDAVNLARKLVDGEQIRVAARGEHPAAPPAAAPGVPGQGATVPGALVDLNSASAEQLDALPGVGQVTVARIIAYRQAHPFRTVEELRQVDGIGDRRFAQLKDLVTVA
jgi:competence protein ComEA